MTGFKFTGVETGSVSFEVSAMTGFEFTGVVTVSASFEVSAMTGFEFTGVVTVSASFEVSVITGFGSTSVEPVSASFEVSAVDTPSEEPEQPAMQKTVIRRRAGQCMTIPKKAKDIRVPINRTVELVQIPCLQFITQLLDADVWLYSQDKKNDFQGVKAVAVLRSGMTLEADEFAMWAQTYMAAYKVPHLLEIVDSLPKSAAGKVLWGQLQDEQDRRYSSQLIVQT